MSSYICSHRLPCAEHGRHDVLCRNITGHTGDHQPIECGPWTYHWRKDPLLKDAAAKWEKEVHLPAVKHMREHPEEGFAATRGVRS